MFKAHSQTEHFLSVFDTIFPIVESLRTICKKFGGLFTGPNREVFIARLSPVAVTQSSGFYVSSNFQKRTTHLAGRTLASREALDV
jgi:hypothetical protein